MKSQRVFNFGLIDAKKLDFNGTEKHSKMRRDCCIFASDIYNFTFFFSKLILMECENRRVV